MYIGLHIKYPLFSSDFKININFLDRFSKNPAISWKTVQWETGCSIHRGGRTDMTELTVAFRNFTKAPRNPNRLLQLDARSWHRSTDTLLTEVFGDAVTPQASSKSIPTRDQTHGPYDASRSVMTRGEIRNSSRGAGKRRWMRKQQNRI